MTIVKPAPVVTIGRLLLYALPFVSLVIASSAHAGFLGIEFDEDDCIEKYSDKMRWSKQRQLMRAICHFKHDDNSRTEKRFAQCVLDSIFEVSDDSNGRRVLQSCSSRVGDEASYRRFVVRFPMQPDSSEIPRQMQAPSGSQHPQPITIIENGLPKPCMRMGETIHCP